MTPLGDLKLGLQLARRYVVRVLGKANLDFATLIFKVDLSLRLSVSGKPLTEISPRTTASFRPNFKSLPLCRPLTPDDYEIPEFNVEGHSA
jgi:hypothetical protein